MTTDYQLRARQIISQAIFERTTATLVQQVTDHLDAVLPAVQLTTLTVEITKEDGTVLVVEVDILGAGTGTGRATITTDGLVTLVLTPADNALTSQRVASEVHLVVLRWSWDSGEKKGIKEIHLTVVNQASTP